MNQYSSKWYSHLMRIGAAVVVAALPVGLWVRGHVGLAQEVDTLIEQAAQDPSQSVSLAVGQDDSQTPQGPGANADPRPGQEQQGDTEQSNAPTQVAAGGEPITDDDAFSHEQFQRQQTEGLTEEEKSQLLGSQKVSCHCAGCQAGATTESREWLARNDPNCVCPGFFDGGGGRDALGRRVSQCCGSGQYCLGDGANGDSTSGPDSGGAGTTAAAKEESDSRDTFGTGEVFFGALGAALKEEIDDRNEGPLSP